MRLLDMRKDKN